MALKKLGRGRGNPEKNQPQRLPQEALVSHRRAMNRDIFGVKKEQKTKIDTLLAQHGHLGPEETIRKCMDFLITKAEQEKKTLAEVLWEHRGNISHLVGPAYGTFGVEYVPRWYRLMSGYILIMNRLEELHKGIYEHFTDEHLLQAADSEEKSVMNALLDSEKVAAPDVELFRKYCSEAVLERATYREIIKVSEDEIANALVDDGRYTHTEEVPEELFGLPILSFSIEEEILKKIDRLRAEKLAQKEKLKELVVQEKVRSPEQEKELFGYAYTCIVDEKLSLESVLTELEVNAEWLLECSSKKEFIEGKMKNDIVKLRLALRKYTSA